MEATRDTAKEQAKLQLEGIVELVNALENGGMVDGKTMTAEEVSDRIQEDPLEVSVRSVNWHPLGQDQEADEYRILLCTGGPAVQITGSLSLHNEPEDAHIEYQDWGTPWTEYLDTTTEEDEMLLQYANHFYFGK